MDDLKQLFRDKIRLLELFQKVTEKGYQELKEVKETEARIDLIDRLSSEREEAFRAILALDQRIEAAKLLTEPSEFERLGQDIDFQSLLKKILTHSDNIRLTDQAVFLYIQSIGGDIRADVLRQLKEKQTVSKFKSQGTPTTGEGLDKTL